MGIKTQGGQLSASKYPTLVAIAELKTKRENRANSKL